MIRSIYGWFCKNKLTKWLETRKQEIREEYDRKEHFLISELETKFEEKKKELLDRASDLGRQDKDMADLEKRVQDRKVDLEKVNAELKTQIRMIEAKARPDHVWTNAFSLGFSKAWDMMMPMMTDGIDKVKEQIKNQEIESSISRINPMIESRLKSLGDHSLLETHELQSKRDDFAIKKQKSVTPEDKIKFEAYLNILDWILESRNGN